MTDDPALLRAVLSRPDDDAPRLIYADWLDEQAQCERAEFLRIQCELSAAAPAFCNEALTGERCRWCDLRWCDLRRRERELLRPEGGIGGVESMWPRPEWSGGVAKFFRPKGNGGYQYRRGFVASVTCAAEDWLRHGDAITAAQPIEEVSLMTLPGWKFFDETYRLREEANNPPGTPTGRVRFFPPTDPPELGALQFRWPRVKKWSLPQPGNFAAVTGQVVGRRILDAYLALGDS